MNKKVSFLKVCLGRSGAKQHRACSQIKLQLTCVKQAPVVLLTHPEMVQNVHNYFHGSES